ncbi:MAG: amino acid adenylation domain-containing protein [Nostoc sp. DedQUE05]|uniref:non-ribosomal peptide synthetase n=1 Tax=Nostoc sp. DedQUE05 TaxID=3075391 RepID=UPI002AD582D7|nr:non-ribosomal peptide synthetase [Nostoc sp. DedQUE05]MDZ8091513.1 amino acid adenylation domain-containing protein [Nostoc sp. DedQUE05]
MTYAQRAIWSQFLIDPKNLAYILQVRLPLIGDLNRQALLQVLHLLPARHEALRTTFMLDRDPVQFVHTELSPDLREIDVSVHSEPQTEVDQIAATRSLEPFDLAVGPLLRIDLVRLSPDRHELIITLHHIICDATSIPLLLRDIEECYQSLIKGVTPPNISAAAPSSVQESSMSIWNSESGRRRIISRAEKMKGVPTLALPTDKPYSKHRSYQGGCYTFNILPTLVADLNLCARKYRTSLFTICLTAFSVLLSRHCQQLDFIIGIPTEGRVRAEEFNQINCFANLVPLRIDLKDTPTFEVLMQRMRHEVFGVVQDNDMPWEMLLDELGLQRDLSRPTLVQTNCQLLHAPDLRINLQGLEAVELPLSSWVGTRNKTAKFDLSLQFSFSKGLLVGAFEYNSDLFEESTVQRWAERLQVLLGSAIANPQCRVDLLPIMSSGERDLVMQHGNGTTATFPNNLTLSELFEAQVDCTPDATALLFEDQQMSYRELEEQSNRLAQRLRQLGVKPEVLVGVCLERSIEMVISLMAILKAGGAYVPLDPDYPVSRLMYMVEDTGAQVVLIQERLKERVAGLNAQEVIVIDGSGEQSRLWQKQSPQRLQQMANSRNLAYVIYTSGSTGRPKGVMIEHRGICNYNWWMQKEFPLNSGERFLQATSLSFDVSVYEIFWPLMVGATVVLVSPKRHLDLAHIGTLIHKQRVVGLHMVPSLMSLLVEHVHPEDCQTLRYAFVSGESLEPALARKFAEHLHSDLINLYGATEVSVDSTFWRSTGDRVFAGRPMDNQAVYVLDEALQPLPIGVKGEVYLGGLSVTRGYHCRPELTAERFLPDPFSNIPGSRMYRTGDLGCLLPDGNLELFGRRDHQIKLHGVRIELGEIETVLAEHPAVTNAVVMVQDGGEQAILVAFAASKKPDIDERSLLSYLVERIPKAVVPNRVVIVEQFPLTPNGKIDRSSLPKVSQIPSRSAVKFTPTERAIADVWEEVLSQRPDTSDISFFELGGNSIQAIRLVSRLRQLFNVEVSVRLVFEHQTVTAMADALATLQQPSAEIETSQSFNQVSIAQRRMWLLDKLSEGLPEYTILVALNLDGKFDVEVFRRALEHILLQNEPLRFRFPEDGGVPRRETLPPDAVVLEFLELSEAVDESSIRALLWERSTIPFDMVNGPLFRPLLIRRSPDEHILLLKMHHIVADGWSIEILLRELAHIYQELLTQGTLNCRRSAPGYSQYLAWEKSKIKDGTIERDLRFWQRTLNKVPVETTFPIDRPRPIRRTGKGATFHTRLNASIARAVNEYARNYGTTPYTILFTGLAILLHRLTYQRDIVMGTVTAGRDTPDLQDVVGLCANTIAIRCSIEPHDSFKHLLDSVRRSMVDAYEHSAASFDSVVDTLKVNRDPSRTPLFQIMVLYRSSSYEQAFNVPNLRSHEIALDSGVSRFDATFQFTNVNEYLELAIEYNSDLFEESTVQRWAERLQVLLGSAIANPQCRVDLLPIMSSGERDLVMQHGNGTTATFPNNLTLSELFEAQVDCTPDATALLFEDQQMSYRELEEQSNRLAQRLRQLGVKPEVLVGVCLERSIEMVISLMAILKAGGAYVPLDPDYPVSRLMYMVEDTGAQVVLIQERLKERVAGLNAQEVIVIDGSGEQSRLWQKQSPQRLQQMANSRNLAYVIYTSGSTGRPKGVMIEHRSVLNRIHWMVNHYGFQPQDRILQKTPFSFDVSVWEFFATLCFGSTLVIAAPGVHRNLLELAKLIERTQTIIIHFVPSVLNYFLDVEDVAYLSRSLRMVICSGEALPSNLAHRCLQTFNAKLHNLYGPTEATVDVSYFSCCNQEWNSLVPIGQPINNTQLYVLDHHLQPVPIGVLGELCIGGLGVGRGYLNNPRLTTERFVPDPFCMGSESRIYLTGDIVRWNSDGAIEFFGRRDTQVKLRGLRIELGEIEAAIVEENLASKAAVVVRGSENPESTTLVAYVVTDNPVNVDTIRTMRQVLSKRLPSYMIPSSLIKIEAMPLSANGKLDRTKLLNPVNTTAKPSASEPETRSERAIAEAWQEVLGVDVMTVEDDFFELGGHSLAASRVVAVLRRQLSIEISLSSVIAHPVLKDLATELDRMWVSSTESRPIIPRLDRRTEAPLSSSQRRIWLDHMLNNNAAVYNVPLAFRIRGYLNEVALEAALHDLQIKHDALRACVADDGKEPRLIIMPEARCRLYYDDLTSLDPVVRDQRLLELKEQEAKREFDLAIAPLLSARLIRLEQQDQCLLLTIHHLVVDGWSLSILWRDISNLYSKHLYGQQCSIALPSSYLTFTDYAWWEREALQSQQWHRDIAFWKRILADRSKFGLPVVDTTVNTPRKGAEYLFDLGPELSSVLTQTAARLHTTPFVLLVAAFQYALAGESKQTDITVAVQVANRLPEVTDIVGLFVNQVPLRTLIEKGQSVVETVHKVNSNWQETVNHSAIPFDVLLRSLGEVPGADGTALTSLAFSFNDLRGSELKLANVEVQAEKPGQNATAKFNVLLEVLNTDKGFIGVIEYCQDRHTLSQIARLFARWEASVMETIS